MRIAALLGLAMSVTVAAQSVDLPMGYWSQARADAILSTTETIRLAPDLSRLTPGEQAAVKDLLQAGEIMQRLYEDSRHHQAVAAHERLTQLHQKLGRPKATQDLLTLYDLFQGPIATTLDNQREPFVPVDPQAPGRNVYPVDITAAELDAFVASHPDEAATLLDERTVVRRATADNLRRDLAALRTGPLATLHAATARRLEALSRTPARATLYAVPYAVAYAPQLTRAFEHLTSAAGHIEASDSEFARYLRNRARDLLSNDYESGDASWVTGRFVRLNAQIGAYETYDDPRGRKAFHALSLLLQDEQATAALRKDLGGLQEIEDALPYEPRKRVREDISIGVYDVIADFGQARGTNTATILPNDPLFSRRYGRTILLRQNIMKHPAIAAADQRLWRAIVAAEHAGDFSAEGQFQRTLWHEIGHYLGVDRDRTGRTLDVGLEEYADALEEMKADLVSLFAADRLRASGRLTPAALRAMQASGIRRVILNNKPRPDQPYQMMQLAQFNYFLDKGLLQAGADGGLRIQYDRYPEMVAGLLREVLAVQYAGDKERAAKFFQQWGAWTPELHEPLAARVRQVQGARYRLVRYGALESEGPARTPR